MKVWVMIRQGKDGKFTVEDELRFGKGIHENEESAKLYAAEWVGFYQRLGFEVEVVQGRVTHTYAAKREAA